MYQDFHGLPISTASAQAAAAFDRVTLGYLKYRADLPARMSALFAADGEFALAHCLKGYFAMLSYKQANVPVAIEAAIYVHMHSMVVVGQVIDWLTTVILACAITFFWIWG